MKVAKKITLKQFRDIKTLETLLKAIQSAHEAKLRNQFKEELRKLSGNPPSIQRKRLGQ